MKYILLSALVVASLFSSIALAQVQSHPISQIFPQDVNLNLTGVNITNVSYVFFGNNSVDTYLYRSGTNTLQTASHLVVTGGWINGTSLNLSSGFILTPSGRVGIGTISPGDMLHIAGDGAIRLEDSSGSLSQIQGGTHGVAGNSKISFRTQEDSGTLTTKMVIIDDGNVGINTTTPSALLNVMTRSTDTKVATNISNYGTGNSFVVEDSAADTSPFVISNAGSVGIGTLSPQNTLNVIGDINATGTIYSAGGTSANVSGAGIAGYIPQWLTSTSFNNSNIYQLGSNVGIGTTSPTTLLQIASDGNQVRPDISFNDTTASPSVTWRVGTSYSGTARGIFYIDTSYGTTAKFAIQNGTGNVGIGTTSPGNYKLNVIGDINASWGNFTNVNIRDLGGLIIGHTAGLNIGGQTPLTQIIDDSSLTGNVLVIQSFDTEVDRGPSIWFGKGDSNVIGTYTTVADGSRLFEIAAYGADGSDMNSVGVAIRGEVDGTAGSNDMPGRLLFMTTADGSAAATERMRITTSGNVGINTTTPNALLNVMTHSTDTKVAANISNYGTGNSFVVEDSAADTSPFLIDNAGNVGIGTASPSTLLDVRGGINASQINITGSGTLLNVSNRTHSVMYVNDTGIGYVVIPQGNVGIGTTSPSVNLEISGAVNPEMRVKGTVASGTSALLTLDRGATGADAKIQFRNAGSDNWFAGMDNTPAGATSYFSIKQANNGDPEFIVDTSGNVGIGTITTNSYKLNVNGSINASWGNFTDVNITRTFNAPNVVSSGGWMNASYVNVSNALYAPSITATGGWLNASNVNVTNTIYATNGTFYGSVWQPIYGSDDGLVLYLPFSEGTGSAVFDRSPYGNDGTLLNMNTTGNLTSGWNKTDCRAGWCMRFDRIDDQINISDSVSLSPRNAITASAWINSEGHVGTGSTRTIVSKYLGGTSDRSFNLELTGTSGNERFTFTVRATGADDNVRSATLPSASRWYHVAGTYDGANMRIYVDGILENTSTAVTGLIVDSTLNVVIGNSNDASARFNGTMDEVMIYDRALSSDEIRTQYLGGLQSHGAVTADKFRIIDTIANKIFEVNRTRLEYNTSKLVVDSSGNVGIGTTSPSTLLDVRGGINASQINITGSGTLLNVSNRTHSFLYVNDTGIGYVGIGTRTPTVKLEIAGDAKLSGSNPTFSLGSNYIGVSNVGFNFRIADSGDGNAMRILGTGGTEIVRITNTGSVGINTTAPQGTLNVVGVSASSIAAANITNLGTGHSLIVMDSAGDTTPFLIDNAGSVGIGTTSPQSLLHVVGTGNTLNVSNSTASHLYVSGTTGNVGIGYTIPQNKLEVSESSNGGEVTLAIANMYTAGSSTDETVALAFNHWVGTASPVYGQPFAGKIVAGKESDYASTNSADSFMAFYTALNRVDTERMRITSAGNVGIGTSSPGNATLNITNSGFGVALDIVNGTTGNHLFQVNSTTGNVGIGQNAALGQRVVIGGTHAASHPIGLYVNPALTHVAGGAADGGTLFVAGTFTTGSQGANIFASLRVLEPQVTVTSGAPASRFATVYLNNAPTEGNVNNVLMVDDSTTPANNATVNITSAAAGNILWIADSAGDTTPFVIDNAGSVGIGTATIASGTILNISGGNVSIATGELNFGDGSSVQTGIIRSKHASNAQIRIGSANDLLSPYIEINSRSWQVSADQSITRFMLNSTEQAMQIGKNGEVYIGNSSGTYSLSVNRKYNVTGSNPGNQIYVSGNTTAGPSREASGIFVQPEFTEQLSGTHPLFAALRLAPGTVNGNSAALTDTAMLYISDNMTAEVTGNNYALWVDDGISRFDGNVGIGTAIPDQLLKVAGDVNITGKVGIGGADYNSYGRGQLTLDGAYTATVSTTGSLAITTAQTGTSTGRLSSLAVLGSITTPASAANTNVASVLVDEPAITVGSGSTIDYASTLYLSGAPTEGRLNSVLNLLDTTTPSGNATVNITSIASGNILWIGDSAGDTSPFVIDNAGSVGIGTASPSKLLHLNTTGDIALILEDGDNPGLAFYDADAGTNTKVAGIRYNNQQIIFHNASDSFAGATNRMVINVTSGSVGIGTASPGQNLVIQGSSANHAIVNISSTNDAVLSLYADSNADNQADPRIEFYEQGVEVARIRTDGSNSNRLTFSGDGSSSDHMVLDSTGRVGIGTTAPQSLLHVSGTGSLLNVSNSTTSMFFVNSTAPSGYAGIANTSKFCLDGNACAHYITWNGSHTIIS